jgi:hypothetical protein
VLSMTPQMLAPRMIAAEKMRYDTTRLALAEEGLPLETCPEGRTRRTGRPRRLTVRLAYPGVGLSCRIPRPRVVEGARARL